MLIAGPLLFLLAAAAEPAPPPPPLPQPAPPAVSGSTLTLAQAEAEALKRQPVLRQARGQTEAAEGRVEQARAGYLPQVSIIGTYQRTTGNFAPRPGALPTMTAMPPPPSWSRTFDFYSFGVTGSQLIYDFGQARGRWNAAAANLDAFKSNEQGAAVQAVLGVRRAYFLARAQRELVQVAQATVSNQEKHVNQTQAFVRAGLRPDIDLAQVRTGLANARVQVVATSNNYAVAMAQLNQAMGLAAGEPHVLADGELPPVPGEDGAAAPLTAEAMRARPELAVLAHQRDAQEATVGAVRGAYGPALSAGAGATETGSSFDRLVPNWFVGLTVTWSILQGGLTHGQVREARGTLTSIAAQEDALRLQISVEVDQARLSITAAKAAIAAASEALANARDQLRLAEARYTNGLGSAIELGDAQVAFSSAEAQEVQARYALHAARADLLAAVGTR